MSLSKIAKSAVVALTAAISSQAQSLDKICEQYYYHSNSEIISQQSIEKGCIHFYKNEDHTEMQIYIQSQADATMGTLVEIFSDLNGITVENHAVYDRSTGEGPLSFNYEYIHPIPVTKEQKDWLLDFFRSYSNTLKTPKLEQ